VVDFWRGSSLLTQKTFPDGNEEDEMPQYMLLLHDTGEDWARLSPEEMQKTAEKYMAWRNKPFVVDGHRLDATGRTLRKQNGNVSVTDGPFSESREVLGGYYTVEAASFDEAIKLAKDNPHVDFGTIEIREVVARPME
jgi:hypothetical protein